MVRYRYYFLDDHLTIRRLAVHAAPTDASALAVGVSELTESDARAVEIWDDARHVGTVGDAEAAVVAGR